MSWTIARTSENSQHLKAMEDAIDHAHKRNILMFCAAKDDGEGSDYGYPTNFHTPPFCIGAAAEGGSLSEGIGSQKEDIDFRLPGVNITPLSGNTKEKISGSSIATALASDLAGLLLYIVQFDRHRDITRSKSQRASLQNHKVFKRTLKPITNNPQRFMRVQTLLDLSLDVEWTPANANGLSGGHDVGGGETALYKIVERY
jgi:hypothetical protein